MNTTKHTTNPAANTKAGHPAPLHALLHGNETGAPKINGGSPRIDVRAKASISARGLILALFCAAVGVLVLGVPSVALAAFEHPYLSQLTGTPTGPGGAEVKFNSPNGVAVDPANQDLYVFDETSNAIDIFEPSGGGAYKYASQISGAVAGVNFNDVHAKAVAVNGMTGEVYVGAEYGVYVFNDLGMFVKEITGGGTPAEGGTPDGSFDGAWGLAVEQSSGDLYVADYNHGVVDRFNSASEYVSQITALTKPEALATSPGGDLYVAESPSGSTSEPPQTVYEFNSSGTQINELKGPPSGSFIGELHLAVDPEGNLYVADRRVAVEKHINGEVVNINEQAVDEFSSAGVFITAVSETPSGKFHFLEGIAVSPAGNLFAVDGTGAFGEKNAPVVDVFGRGVLLPDVTTGAASAVTGTTATVAGSVAPDPEGSATSYEFEYGPTEGYGSVTPTVSVSAEGPVVANLTGLTPDSVYHYRLVATNSSGYYKRGADATFHTQGPPQVPQAFATEVTSSSVRVGAQIDPDGLETTYQVQYATSKEYAASETYGQSTPVAPLLAADQSDHAVSVQIQGLLPGETYRYRVVAVNELSGPTVTLSKAHTFTTQPPATTQPANEEQALPDGRQYELVSPVEKDGAEILGIVGSEGATRTRGAVGGSAATQAAENGTKVTYLASAPIGSNPPANTHSSQIISTRGADGWSSQDIENPQPNIGHFNYNKGEEYRLFSQDLSSAVVQSSAEVDESPLAPELHQEAFSNAEIYLRDNITSSFQALVTEQLPQAQQSPQEVLREKEAGEASTEFVGATPDLSHVVFSSHLALKTNSIMGVAGGDNLYDWSDGRPQLVNVLPSGTVADGAFGGGVERETNHVNIERLRVSPLASRHAISSEGARVVWGNDVGLYSRDMVSEETVQLDESEDGGVGGGGAFQAASSDGTRVFFTDQNELENGAGEGDLYMFDITAGKEKLKDLTPGGADGGKVYVLGADEAGTTVYVIAQGVLPSTANAEGVSATAGASNVYVLREGVGGVWGATFIATLTPSDADAYFQEGIGGDGDKGGLEVNIPVRVSASGRYLAFMSEGSLTGYDNRDADSGEPDEEVYLYDAEANRLVCASCDPSGARPVGEYDKGWHEQEGLPMDPASTWKGHWVAAMIPGVNENNLVWGAGSAVGSLYQSRVLSDEGRLFFDSADALVPQDVNGVEDVYEYEPPANATEAPANDATEAPANDSCTTGLQTYSAGSEGCVSLISSGKEGGEASVFVDASTNGDDVFFTTSDRLVKEDQDSSTDLYDAHVCTSEEPCYPTVVSGSPPCTTTESCRAAPVPQPALFGAPASATFSGSGNVAPASTPAVSVKKKVETAAQVRAEKLKRALKVCKRRAKNRRKGCEAQARKRYGRAKASRASKSSGWRSN